MDLFTLARDDGRGVPHRPRPSRPARGVAGRPTCHVHLIHAEAEREVVAALREKWTQHEELTHTMSMTRPKPTAHEVEHDCHLDGQPVRHTAVIEATPTRLNDGRTRWSGVRCDGSRIEWVEP